MNLTPPQSHEVSSVKLPQLLPTQSQPSLQVSESEVLEQPSDHPVVIENSVPTYSVLLTVVGILMSLYIAIIIYKRVRYSQ
ncbi:MAG: hypothetical protein AAFU78_15155, partial [Cyanobacteria bacterium J06633_2]